MKGIGASPGIGIGKIFIYRTAETRVERRAVEDAAAEIRRLDRGIRQAALEVQELRDRAAASLGEEEAGIFSAQRMMLEDPELHDAAAAMIQNEGLDAAFAVRAVFESYLALFRDMEDEYLKARAADIRDVSSRLVRVLSGLSQEDPASMPAGSILIAKDLTPSDTILLDPRAVAGIVTETGGRTSHSAIMARSLGIPAIVSAEGILAAARQGAAAVMDGSTGQIHLDPAPEVLAEYEALLREADRRNREMRARIGEKTVSLDGRAVEVAGNIGSPGEAAGVLEQGGEGVGLFRTEFLYMGKDRLPTEEEQFLSYRAAARLLGTRPLVIRTLDAGGDKELPYLGLPREANPYLGHRAIRLCLERQDLFEPQLRAILRAGAYGNVRMMLPMVTGLREVREAKERIEKVKRDLRAENILFCGDMPLGVMIETPAAALQSEALAGEVDFFSIGTNDLIQYTLAADRGNPAVEALHSPYHPAVLKLIRMTVENAHKAGIWVGMCGEAAADEKLIPVFLAMGLDELSMSASSIPGARHLIRSTSVSRVAPWLDELLALPGPREAERFLELHLQPGLRA